MEMMTTPPKKGRAKRIYEAAVDAASKDNYSYAVELFRDVLRKEPGCLEARQRLRQVELKQIGGSSTIWRQMVANLLAIPNLVKGPMLLRKQQFPEALDNAEAALARDPTAQAGLQLLARAAEEAELNPVVLETLELAVEHHPKSLGFLNWLAATYSALGMGRKALEIRRRIAEFNPKNQKYQEDLRQAAAEAALDDGNWERAGDYRDLIKDKTEAALLEQQERSTKDVDVARTQLTALLEKVQSEDTVENRRRIAEHYAQLDDYEKALENYNLVVEMSGMLDPAIDEAITKLLTRQADAAIREWQEYLRGELSDDERQQGEAQLADIRQQRREMLIGRYEDRVQRYPNSTPDRFELGRLLFEDGRADDALRHMQMVQKKPQYRVQATHYMGQCFAAKGLHDMAVNEFKRLVDEVKTMNQMKKQALYFLAKSYEALERTEEAAECYKTIYQADMNFMDVAEVMERLYRK